MHFSFSRNFLHQRTAYGSADGRSGQQSASPGKRSESRLAAITVLDYDPDWWTFTTFSEILS